MKRFNNKVALITRGISGIGLATAIQYKLMPDWRSRGGQIAPSVNHLASASTIVK